MTTPVYLAGGNNIACTLVVDNRNGLACNWPFFFIQLSWASKVTCNPPSCAHALASSVR